CFEKERVTLGIAGRPLHKMLSFMRAEFDAQPVRNPVHDFSFHCHHVRETAVELLAPELHTLSAVDQLCSNDQPPGSLAEPTSQNGPHAKAAANLNRIN